MVCLLLGSGGSLVADAAGITYLNPTTWDLSMTVGAKVEILSNGGYRITSTAASITAFMADLESGSTYDLTIRLTPYNAASDGTIGIGVVDSNGDVLTLFEAEKAINGTSYLKSIKFKVPDNFVSARLVVVSLNVSQLIFTPSQSSLTDSSTDKGILNSLKEGFAKLWEWLKGIWDSIKEIPTKIAASLTALGDRIRTFFTDLVDNMRNFFSSLGDRISGFFTDMWEKIKSFFLPHDGYFDEYSAKFNAFIDEHFGFLAQLPDELSLIINTLVNYTPADPPYIDFPTVKVPIPGHEFTLIQGRKYVFTILTQSPYNMLYSAYQGFVWLAYCLMLFNFLKHKYNVIFGGDGSAD